MRRTMPSKREPLSDIPDFLQSSPYLPILSEEIESHERARRPVKSKYTLRNLRQFLRQLNQWRGMILFGLVLYFLYNWDWKTMRYGPLCLSYKPAKPVALLDGGVDWSHFAYAQYVTNSAYLCNSLIIFETLYRVGSRAQRLMMYPSHFIVGSNTTEGQLLLKARTQYAVKLVPVEIQHKTGEYYAWADSLTKLLIFNQTKYKRILLLDSDSTLLQSMDELFFLPSQPAIMPRAYWLDRQHPTLASHIMLIEPSITEYKRVKKAISQAEFGDYDMEIMNNLHGRRKDCIVLPHRQYALLIGEFRSKNHNQYMDGDVWDARTVFDEAKLVHFSDHPLDKPWKATIDEIKRYQPECENGAVSTKACEARDIWLSLYMDHKKREKTICNI